MQLTWTGLVHAGLHRHSDNSSPFVTSKQAISHETWKQRKLHETLLALVVLDHRLIIVKRTAAVVLSILVVITFSKADAERLRLIIREFRLTSD